MTEEGIFEMIVYHSILHHNIEFKKFLFYPRNSSVSWCNINSSLNWEKFFANLQNCYASEELHRSEIRILLVFSWF